MDRLFKTYGRLLAQTSVTARRFPFGSLDCCIKRLAWAVSSEQKHK
jgi:hypothetical protein